MSYSGQLRTNEIFSALYNMIISQTVFADNVKGTFSSLVDANRVDGSMYGDTKLYYETDCLRSYAWTGDSEAQNLLNLYRPAAPDVDAIYLDVFRYIPVTVDNYLSKRAFADEGSFAQFNAVILGWLRDTKKIYDATTYNVFVGTEESNTGSQTKTISLPTQALGVYYDGTDAGEYGDDLLATAKLEALTIGQSVADTLIDVQKPGRDYNDLGYMRSYGVDDFYYVWNAAWVNKITKLDVPTIFNKEGLIDKFGQYTLPADYFGEVNGTTVTTTGAANSSIRSLIEQDVTDSSSVVHHVFAGELMPNNVTLVSGGSIVYPTYTEDGNIVCKMIHKDAAPYMSGFETETNFFNEASLTNTHRLIFAHNTLKRLAGKPFITIKVSA